MDNMPVCHRSNAERQQTVGPSTHAHTLGTCDLTLRNPCVHCVGSQSRAWNSKTPLLKPFFAQITNLNCRLSTLPTLEQAVFSLILCQLLLWIKEWEVWRRNSDETRKQLQAEWMLLQSVWLIDLFFFGLSVFFLIMTGQQFHLKWWRQNGTWQTVFTLTSCQSVSCKATAHSCG